VGGDLADIFVLSLVAMANPTLLAATTAMMLLPNPRRLMAGYLLGAYATSITAGILIVYALNHSHVTSAAKHTISPGEDIAVGVLCLVIAYILRAGLDRPFRERRQAKKAAKSRTKEEAGKSTESLPIRLLRKGDPRLTFVAGAVLSFPGASFISAMDHIHKLHPGKVASVLLVVYFCLMQQILLEIPLFGFIVAPDSTQARVNAFKAWLGRRGRTVGVIAAGAIGALLILRGLLSLG
jgi:Sap, sulfolipid-1-addressing protein